MSAVILKGLEVAGIVLDLLQKWHDIGTKKVKARAKK